MVYFRQRDNVVYFYVSDIFGRLRRRKGKRDCKKSQMNEYGNEQRKCLYFQFTNSVSLTSSHFPLSLFLLSF